MEVRVASIPGLIIIEPKVRGDERGFFMESYSRDRQAEAGLPREFVQDNVSVSARGILHGMHLQNPHGQGKLCSVLDGEVFDVAVDVRVGSPTFGRQEGVTLSSENKRQRYVPPGFCTRLLRHERVVTRATEWVVNCAAQTAVDDAEEREDLAMEVNGQAVGWLA